MGWPSTPEKREAWVHDKIEEINVLVYVHLGFEVGPQTAEVVQHLITESWRLCDNRDECLAKKQEEDPEAWQDHLCEITETLAKQIYHFIIRNIKLQKKFSEAEDG
mmetsp:Transcript_14127/g.22019  ORF Transcript_14127/g.22019 Transcript_14127/m.22019 type:complete len:106 (+) Transcript_14127:451-768(+)|eukprot:CAMPEP_0170485616 /NCGR_PEP_ID=MMETSP0208-20121228/4850_1 /TAXON_ID=197538 /ORGANISM="Strombidium inclinatum, Strain S3" /LENGTH=105 /DNA_ID=CAMNT_0010759321 /DNA_START=393 /DNA_END=710 /DNA_ORIENTATION=-